MNTQKYLTGLIIVQAALIGFCVFYQAPCSDEFGHAYAGLRYWQDGDLQTFNVNPPLVRAIGALPLYLAPLKHQPVAAANVPYGRPEFAGGRELYSSNGKDFRIRLSMGRLLVSCFAILGTIACYLLGKQIGDERVGLGAAAFWALQPQVIAHGALITNDIPVAATMAFAALCFIRWRSYRTWTRAFVLGVSLGLACSCKFTALILCPIFLGFIIVDLLAVDRKIYLTKFASASLIAFIVVAVPYRFSGIGTLLKEYHFLSNTLAGSGSDVNRFAGTWLGELPVLMPEQFLLGLDRQQVDFETGLASYAMGERSHQGWWWFYLYSMVVKMPTGTLLAIVSGIAYWLRGKSERGQGSGVLWVIALAMVEVTAWKNGFAQQHRYIFPLYPPLFVLIAMPLLKEKSNGWRCTTQFALGLSAIGALSVSPNWLAAFNIVSGGTANGQYHLFNDATDWGQDSDRVVAWIRDHPHCRPLRLHSFNSFGGISEKTSGLPSGLLNPNLETTKNGPSDHTWWVISKTDLVMSDDLRERFLGRPPDDRIGATHLVYRTVEQQ